MMITAFYFLGKQITIWNKNRHLDKNANTVSDDLFVELTELTQLLTDEKHMLFFSPEIIKVLVEKKCLI